MTPSLQGRLETRFLLTVAVGFPVALLASAFGWCRLPAGVMVVVVMAVLGVAWDAAYDHLQRRRRDRDWPTLFALASVVPEAVLAWVAVRLVGGSPAAGGFIALVGVLWSVGFLVQQGPLRVAFPYWRHDGGRVIHRRPRTPTLVRDTAPEPLRAVPEVVLPTKRSPRLVGLALACVAAAVAFGMVAFGGAGQHTPLTGSRAIPADMHDHAMPAGQSTHQMVMDTWDTSARVAPTSLITSAGPASVQRVGLDGLGVLRAPSAGTSVGWYAASPAPGQAGVSVLTGAMSGSGAALQGLGGTKVGSSLAVQRDDGSVVVFRVTRVLTTGTSDFPTRQVYSPTKVPSLRVIGASGTAADARNVILFATASGVVPSHA